LPPAVASWQLHRGIGMGGDKYVGHVAGDNVEREHGDALRDAWVEEFNRLIGEVRPFAATAPLLKALKRRGFRVVLASSGKTEHDTPLSRPARSQHDH